MKTAKKPSKKGKKKGEGGRVAVWYLACAGWVFTGNGMEDFRWTRNIDRACLFSTKAEAEEMATKLDSPFKPYSIEAKEVP